MAPGHTETLLLLMGVVQVYELLLTGLAWFLISRRRGERDGRMLLLLELVFLVDGTYLSAEYSAADPGGGVLVGLVTLALGLRFRLKAHAFLAVHFGALLGIPLLSAKMFQQSLLSDSVFYAIWWLVGILPLVQAWVVDEFQRRGLRKDWLRPLERNFRIAFIVLPYASVCWHAASMHWVYGLPFHASYLTPAILGLGVSLTLMGERWLSRPWCIGIRWLTPLLALALSVQYPSELLFSLGSDVGGGVLFSPLRFALVAAGMVYVFSFWSYRWQPFLTSAAITFLLAGAGHSISSIVDTANFLVPKSAVEWCMASIVGAFVFLGMGAAVSLSNDSRPRHSLKSR
jgi:hypothetical protein